jgi:glycosyltransferase involved in cell wall biosynthesis
MKETDIISIIVPVFNGEKSISHTLDAIYAQTYRNFEILVVDDGSIDNSKEICKKYSAEKGQLQVFYQQNQGPASARNLGLQHASGNLVYFLDSDDLIKENALETLMLTYKKSNADWILTEYYDLFDDGQTVPCNYWSPGKCLDENDDYYLISKEQFVHRIIANAAKRTGINCWGNLYLLEKIQKYNIFFDYGVRRSEDFSFCLKYISCIETIAIPKKLCFYYRQDTTHVSTKNTSLSFDDYISDIERIPNYLQRVLMSVCGIDRAVINRCVASYLFNLIFPWLVKNCRNIDMINQDSLYLDLKKLINSPLIRHYLKYYIPAKGHSQLLPLFLKLKAIRLLIVTGKKIAAKRYGKNTS